MRVPACVLVQHEMANSPTNHHDHDSSSIVLKGGAVAAAAGAFAGWFNEIILGFH